MHQNLKLNELNNIAARSALTKLKLFQKLITICILILGISISLLTFEKAKSIGLSILTSAGIIGVIIGFAAQKSIGMILAGLQLAITQPIRIDDVVVIEGEWGKVEELTLTYVVVKIWDERRLILPVNYFLEKPFQNWTRTNSDILGSVILKINLTFDVTIIRNLVQEILIRNTDWDKRVANVQVTDCGEYYKDVRILLSSADASKSWDLRVHVREKVIFKLAEGYPEALVSQSINVF